MAHDVFIGYTEQDTNTAGAVCRTIESEGIRCWIAPRDILPGADWRQSIFEAIQRARIFVLVFSAAANESEQVHSQVRYANYRGISILPLRIDDVRPAHSFEYFLGNVQWLDARERPLELHLKRVADEIKWRLEQMDSLDRPARLPGVGAGERVESRREQEERLRRREQMDQLAQIQDDRPAPAPPPPSALPAGRGSGGGLFRALTGMLRRRASTPPAPSRAAPAPLPQPPIAAHPSGTAANISRTSMAGASHETPHARVDFSVYAPARVQPGASFLLNVWASLPGQRAEMVERAAGPSRKVEIGSRGGILLPSEAPLLLRLCLDGFRVDNPIEPFAWHGQVTNVSFLVSAPAGLAPRAYPGEVQLLDGGMLLGRFFFELVVAAAQTAGATAPQQQTELRSEWMRSAFASYASPDREKVVQRVQGITATGVKVYLDVTSLRTGNAWEEQLKHAIETTDVFYLFWSRFAKASEHVETEWRTALEKKGLAFIHPIPLEDPRHAQPPTELSSLHFNDIYLAVLKATAPEG